MPVSIRRVDSDFEREVLAKPFGFKGGYLSKLWQTVALMEGESGDAHIGLGTQSVLWADPNVFADHTESGANALMYALTERALQLANGASFETPIALLEDLLEEVHSYGKELTGNPHLQKTFALNALVPVDHAAWLVYAAENDVQNFDAMIPEVYRDGLSYRHDKVASIPAFGFDTSREDIRKTAEAGYYFMKIKMGHPGTQEEMLKKDKEWLSTIHEALGDLGTPYTESGKIPYYLDANGRYAGRNVLEELLDHADQIGALDQIVIVEEPFQEGYDEHVGGLPVRIAADESAHTAQDARRVIQQGYEAIALKPVAKTLSMTLKIVDVAHEHGIPCFCADLTVNPILVDWNKNVAARLHPFPGFNTGLLETNGHQNYANWEEMETYHPHAGAPWTQVENGVFTLGEQFYERSGGIFARPEHYWQLMQPARS